MDEMAQKFLKMSAVLCVINLIELPNQIRDAIVYTYYSGLSISVEHS